MIKIIDELSNIMIGIIRTGVILRFIFCMMTMQKADDEVEGMKKRAINSILHNSREYISNKRYTLFLLQMNIL